MSKTGLLVLTAGLICGLIGVAYGAPTATINVTATVATATSISPGTTTYAFGTGLNYGTTYHHESPITAIIYTNDGKVPCSLQVRCDGGGNWSYLESDDMSVAPTGDDNAKIGGNWGTSAAEVAVMTLIKSGDGLKTSTISKGSKAKLWLGIWTPEKLSAANKADGAVALTVTATAD